MDWLQIVVLSLVQGITEFLPISSSAHLLLPSLLTDWPDQGLAFDVGVHFGSLMAVVVYFRLELTRMGQATFSYPVSRNYTSEVDWVCKLALATLPVVIFGLFLKDAVEDYLRTLPVIAAATIGFGLLLWWSDRAPGERELLTWRDAAIVGLAQVLALLPGTSRSGITITAALLLGLNRTTAARFSFLLSIPTIAGAQLLLSIDLLDEGFEHWPELLASASIAGLSAYACIHFFIALVNRTGMLPYVIYRLLLGAVLIGFMVT
ncbi:MAG: undecaprenyl-diphosphatase [Limisphaerales bacterium]